MCELNKMHDIDVQSLGDKKNKGIFMCELNKMHDIDVQSLGDKKNKGMV